MNWVDDQASYPQRQRQQAWQELQRATDRLSRLSSAESALVLQALDTTSKLAAAATCKRMLRDAMQPLAWKQQTFTVTSELLARHVDPSPWSLLQVVPVRLRVTSNNCPPTLLDGVRRLFSLEVSSAAAFALPPLLQHPVGRRAQQVVFEVTPVSSNDRSGPVSPFSRVRLRNFSRPFHAAVEASLTTLLDPRTSCCTELWYRSAHREHNLAATRAIHHIAHSLRRLHISADVFLAQAGAQEAEEEDERLRFDAFCATPSMMQLQLLTLMSVSLPADAASEEAAEFRAGLSALRSLHTLRLLNTPRPAPLLALLPAAAPPALTLLYWQGVELSELTPALLACLRTLLRALPQLRLDLSVEHGYMAERARMLLDAAELTCVSVTSEGMTPVQIHPLDGLPLIRPSHAERDAGLAELRRRHQDTTTIPGRGQNLEAAAAVRTETR